MTYVKSWLENMCDIRKQVLDDFFFFFKGFEFCPRGGL